MRLQSRCIQLALAAVLCSILAACATASKWQYPPQPPGTLLDKKAAATLPARVAVLPLRDERGTATQSYGWLAAVPLVPYGVNSSDRPESAQDPAPVPIVKMDPTKDLPRAVADELRNAALFSSVTFAENNNPAGADLVLAGTLRSTKWRRSITTYGLGPLGPFLWILGAPIGNGTSTVVMDYKLTPANNPSRILWGFSMEAEEKHLIGIYLGLENVGDDYARATQDAIRQIMPGLLKVAAEKPDQFKASQ